MILDVVNGLLSADDRYFGTRDIEENYRK